MTLDVEEALRVLFPQGVTHWSRLPGGSLTPSWRVEACEGTFAVKFYPREAEATALGTARLLGWLRDARFPVPHAIVSECPGGVALQTSWAPGCTIVEALQREPQRAGTLGRAFGEVHARLHALRVPDAVLPVLPRDERGRSMRCLHLDFHPANVLTDEGEVTAVLDWENVHLGDPRVDVARTLSILSVDPAVWTLPTAERRRVRMFRRAYLAEYASKGGALDGMAPFLSRAGETMRSDLAHRYSTCDLEHVERWTRHVRRLAASRRPSSKGRGIPRAGRGGGPL